MQSPPPDAIWMLLAAGVAALWLGVHLRTRATARMAQTLRLLAHGGSGPLPPLAARTGDRLERDRDAMARTLEALGAAAHAPGPPQGAVAFPGDAARELGAELADIAAQIRRPGAGVAGLAQAELLIADARSVLYGHDPVTLRQELGRVRFLLLFDQGWTSPRRIA
jgi:hypothetical protein